jgi:DNA-nicking Smr family endonuclease
VTNKRDRTLSEEEHTLWQGIARSIKPLRRASAKKIAAPPVPAATPRPPAKQRTEKRAAAAPPRAPQPPPPPPQKPIAPLDRRTKQKLARGREAIDARLDLHGMTQAEAHTALARFLRRAQADGCKFVLVVTGKGVRGSGETRGVLRRQVPQWLALAEFRELVIGFEAAHVGHGGEGALYVRVRRPR